MNALKMVKKFSIAFLVLSALSFELSASSLVWAQGPPRITLETIPQKISLMVGESRILKINEKQEPPAKVELIDPKIAEVILLTRWQIYISGKTPGITTLVLRGKDNVAFFTADLEVTPDLSRLKEMLHKILPEEKDIRVNYTHDSITLSGTVSSTSNLSQAMALAQSYLPKEGKVINLLEVAGVHQVMLEVRVAEMSRSVVKRLGFNFNFSYFASNGLELVLANVLNNLSTSAKLSATGSVNKLSPTGHFGISQFVDALRENGLIKILAEPNLITLSGKTANFLAGGEFPVPVPQSGGGVGFATISIEYKPFGVGLNFTPTVLSNNKISMHVAPEVSELDFSNGITISGFVVPALTTRRVSTVIELADGQSFAIAGLLKEEIRETIDKFPLLGDIPILGALFTSSSFQKNETELIIIVTPHLVKPLDMAKQTLPTDQFIEPDDFEFYLLGNLEGKEKIKSSGAISSKNPDKGHGLEGNFGHIVPK
jgi:pilus assembly protein CpaC